MSSPFKFLDAYTKDDDQIFFGREQEIDELYQMVFRSNLVLVYGESGTGKTSVIQCGLANKFKDEDWFALFIRRQNNINESFENKLQERAVTAFTEEQNTKVSVVQKIKSLYLDYFKPLYLVFDQFEELFILGAAEEREKFVENLKIILESDVPCTIILIIREEYLGHLYGFERTFPNLFDQRLRIEPMTTPKVKTVLEKSFDRFNISAEQPAEERYQQIIENISSGISGIQLPYLQVYLDELYREDFQRTHKRERLEDELPPLKFTRQEVEEFGRIDDVLERYLNTQIENLQAKLQTAFASLPDDTVTRILDAFITEEGTKRPLRFIVNEHHQWIIDADEELMLGDVGVAPLSDCLKYLERARLVRLIENNIELAHDSLGSIIFQRRSADQRRRIELRRRLRHAHREYLETGQLLNLQQITTFEEALAELNVTPEQCQFIADSSRQIEDEQQAQIVEAQRQTAIEKRRRQRAVLLSVFALIGLVFATYQYFEANRARKEAEANIQMMRELIGEITDQLQNEKNAGIIGLAALERDLFEKLLPYHQYISENTAKLDKSWESARTHLRLGHSYESLGNSIESQREFQIAFNEAKAATEAARLENKVIPGELYRTLIDAAVYHSWNHMNKHETAEAQSVLFSARDLTKDENLNSAYLIFSHAKLENAISRLMIEKKDSRKALIHAQKAVEFARRAVNLQEDNLLLKAGLAIHLNNLSLTPDSLLAKEEQVKYRNEGCQIAEAIDNTPGSGVTALITVINCIYDKSFDLTNANKYDEAIVQLQGAKARLDMILKLDPSKLSYYLHRSRINIRLSDIELARLNREAMLKYTQDAAQDWLKVVSGGPVLPQEIWILRYVYGVMRDFAQDIKDADEKIEFYKSIAFAIDTSASVYGNVPAIALIATDSYTLLGQFMREKKIGADTILTYLNKAVEFSNKSQLLSDISTFRENYEWLCRAYSQRLQVNCENGNLEQALVDYHNINEKFGPVLEKYPFDYFLRTHFTESAMRIGELLFKAGRYKEALPILEYASKWGMKSSTEYLARIYRKGLTGNPDIRRAEQLEDLAPKQTIKKFTVPCDFGGVKAPFDVFIRELPEDTPFKGIDDQAEWLWQARGGTVPEAVKTAFKQLQIIAWRDGVSYPDLCVEALDAANKEKKKNTGN